jgi:hypothetical protein
VKGEVWEKRIQKRLKRMKKGLDRVSIVRDVRFGRLSGLRVLLTTFYDRNTRMLVWKPPSPVCGHTGK